MSKVMTVVQCWDDGVSADARVTEILRRYGAKATFNLNAGLHEPHRKNNVWIYKDTPVSRLGWDEMREIYDGFLIANHSLTHPSLNKVTVDIARYEIDEGRKRLQQFFGQPILGFAYPNGAYNDEVMKLIHEAGHVYARTTHNVEQPFPPENPMAFHPCCHFLAPDLWARYEKAREGGVFYFWGHSYELITEPLWNDFEEMIKKISADPGSRWGDVVDLFADYKKGRKGICHQL